MKDNVLRFCLEQKLIPPGSTVVCAVSGGADSMALLRCLLDLQEALGCQIAAAHFNHQLRGTESDADEIFVQAYCRSHRIPLFSGRGDVASYAKTNHCSIEDAARTLRYDFFSTLSGLIATAHTADDNAETVLMNLLRGSGLKGLCGIPAVRTPIIRPILCVTREDVLAYLRETDTPWREDSSNREDTYRRNRIRHHVIPLLKEENPALSQTILAESLRLRAEEHHLATETQQALRAVQRTDGYDCAAICVLSEALQRRVLLQILQISGTGDAHHVETLRQLVLSDAPVGQTILPQNRTAKKSYGLLRILAEPQPTLGIYPLPIPGSVTLPETGMTIRTMLLKNSEDFSGNPDTILINYAMIKQTISVRPRQTGDVIALPGGSRSLKRLLIDRKIPSEERNRIPVLSMGEQIVAVCGIGADRHFLPEATSPVLAIQFIHQDRYKEKEEYRSYDAGH